MRATPPYPQRVFMQQRPAGLGHLKAHSSLIVNRQAEDDLTPLPGWAPGTKTISDEHPAIESCDGVAGEGAIRAG